MDVVNTNDGLHEQQESLLQEENVNIATPYTTDSESCGSNDQLSEDFDKTSNDGEDLKSDLQKTFPQCYKSDLSCSSTSCSEITYDEELQASALCQFMDILNDLDEVLDKSLLACLDNEGKFDSDEEDVVCKPNNDGENYSYSEGHSSSLDDDTQVILTNCSHTPICKEIDVTIDNDINIPQGSSRGRSKSFSEAICREPLVSTVEQAGVVNESLRSSMRRLDPIVLPAIPQRQPCEPLTLPVILFLEHHVNMRPTSAPIQLQVTTANLSSEVGSAPLIVGRRALLMNRAISLQSPEGSENAVRDWTGRNTALSATQSLSASSTSTESLNGIVSSAEQAPAASEERNEETEEPPFGVWPHRLSSMLACLSCTVGIFNISRFAIFSVHFGASFIIQFFILSLLVGIPLFTLYLCLGHVLQSGPIDMWRISPIFQGVGVSLLLTQAVIGMYSIIGLSWIFVYFRDSFITANDRYKWSMPLDVNFEDVNFTNTTFKIEETLPQYFHGEVLQRNLASNNTYFGSIKFQVAFNLAVVWMIVFVALSKGLRSYGKAVYVLIFLPICGILILCTKLLTLIPYDSVINIFSETEWSEFFINSNSWAAAAQETFLTWGLLGACMMQLTSHKNAKSKTNIILQKESACIVSFTFAVLMLASFLANTCIQILKNNGFEYIPSSFENVKVSQFLWAKSEPLPGSVGSTPVRYMGHYGSLVGVTVWRTGTTAHQVSGWHPLQLATQIVPATLATMPTDQLSPVWAVIFYFILIMFGIAQQVSIWHCVITGIMAINAEALRVWETTITFLSCVFGLMMGLLLTTDAGVRIVHFVDYVWVGAWWQCLVHVALACGVFVVRGRPYSGDVVVGALYSSRGRLSATLAALLSFTWNVILPVVLCAVCVIDFRTGIQRQLYSWRRPVGYWAIWARQTGVVLQQGALLAVPAVAFIQTWRYMNKGPRDILERVQNLYRPPMGPPLERPPPPPSAPGSRPPAPLAPLRPDPPPKYTPPPSYSTATGARLLSTIRRSFRTLRRMTTRTDSSPITDASQIPITLSETIDNATSITPSLTVTDEVDGNRPTSSRDLLRLSLVRRTDSAKNLRSSLRRSFKYGGGLTTSHEQLVRDVEPISNTVAMSAMLDTSGSPPPHTRASVI